MEVSLKFKIAYVIQHPPAYNYIIDQTERPPNYWDTPDGSWVGIWEGDIGDLFGREILKITDDIEYEIWRPDLRADKIYSHTFKSGVKHITFPAHTTKFFMGLKKLTKISSPALFEHIEKMKNNKLILHLNTLGDFLNQEIIRRFPAIPKVINFHGTASSIPGKEMFRVRKNVLANLTYLKFHKELNKSNKIFFTYQNSRNIGALAKYNCLGIDRIFTGVDFNHLKKGDKGHAKAELGLKPETFVFLVASRLEEYKRIDRIIKILTRISRNDHCDFVLIIAGRGRKEYEQYLQQVAAELLKKDRIKFVGFKTGDDLLRLYQAADLFISAATQEGGPTSVIKACACEVPVFCTRVGGVDDILAQHNAGILVHKNNFKEWANKLQAILGKQCEVKTLNRKTAKELFHWPYAAGKYLSIYNILAK